MTTSTPFPTLDELLDQERRLVLPALDENAGLAIGMRLLAKAVERDLPVTIEVRRGSRVVFRAARNGTTAHNDMFVAGKVRVVEHFGHSSLYERLRHEAAGTTFEAATLLPFPEYAPHGGGFPLIVEGTGPVGVAVVSGLPMQDDHALVVEGLEDYLAERQA
jgi:uncharacterized protein (UPF0303 family)